MMNTMNELEALKRNVPLKLQGQNRWTVWMKGNSGRISIYQPSEMELLGALPTDPYTWDSLDEALRALLYNPAFSSAYREGNAGVAYINSKTTPLGIITLYGAIQSQKRVAPWALSYLDTLDAYAEEGVVPGSLAFLWEGPLEPFSRSGVTVAQPPFIALTLKRIPGTPIRVGTAKTRYARFLELVEEASKRYADKMAERYASYGPVIAEALGKLAAYGLRPRAERRWIATCPACKYPKPSLSVALEDRLYFSCSRGCTPREIVAALGLEWDTTYFAEKPLPAIDEEAQLSSLDPGEEARAYARVEDAYLNFFNSPENHPLLLAYGIPQEAALEFKVGAEGEGDLLIPSFLWGDGEKLLGFRVFSSKGEIRESYPSPDLPWVSPGYREAEAFLVTAEPLTALALDVLLSKDPQRKWAVLYTPEEAPLPTSLFRRGKTREVYLWNPGRLGVLQRWRESLKSLPYRVYLMPASTLPFGKGRAEVLASLRSLLSEAEFLE